MAQASGRQVAWQKSLVGEGVFTHEAGIHVDGLLKNRLNYQGIDPRCWAASTASSWASIRAAGRRGRSGAARRRNRAR